MWLWKFSLLPSGWCQEPEPWTSTSFLRYGTPDWAEGEGRTVYICGYSKEHQSVLFQINNNSFPFHQSLALRDIFPLAVGKASLVWGRNPQRKRGVFYIVRPPICSVTYLCPHIGRKLLYFTLIIFIFHLQLTYNIILVSGIYLSESHLSFLNKFLFFTYS